MLRQWHMQRPMQLVWHTLITTTIPIIIPTTVDIWGTGRHPRGNGGIAPSLLRNNWSNWRPRSRRRTILMLCSANSSP